MFMTRLVPRNCQLAFLTFFLLLSAGAPPAAAQDAGKVTDQATAKSPDKGEASASTPERKTPETLLELIVAGGPLNISFLSVLGLFSLVALAVILERLANLTTRKLIPPEFVDGLQQ